MKTIFLTSMIAAGALAQTAVVPAESATASEFHVAPTGNDGNPGTVNKPFATLEQKRKEGLGHRITRLDLAGSWRVQLDRANEGEKSRWATRPLEYAQPVQLPGSLTSNGIGDDIGPNTPWMGVTTCGTGNPFVTDSRYAPYRQAGANFKVPFWLQPIKFFKGSAWYQREVDIPPSWRGKQITLHLERCHWKSTVFVDGSKVGSQNSLATPHRYALRLTTGRHRLTICVDNNCQVGIGVNASSITDHTQGNWNGIIGDISLIATDPVGLEDVQVYPDIQRKVARVKVNWRNATGQPFTGTLKLEAESFNSTVAHRPAPVKVNVAGDQPEGFVEALLPMGDGVQLWDEFSPVLYRLRVTLAGADCRDEKTVSFGMREIKTRGRSFLVNDIPRMMRGTLDCAAFPKTGYPPTDVAEWRRIFQTCKAYGLNHVRFHSWCPPEAAFAAGDLEGMYLQIECGVWLWGDLGSKVDVRPWLLAETARINNTYGNHPSFVFFVHGNEPTRPYHDWLRSIWLPAAKKQDARHLVAASVLYPLTDNSDFLVPGTKVSGFHYRYQGALNNPPATTRNYEEQILRRPQPCIAHETGQWCVFPNLKEIAKYTGCIKARNFEIVKDFLAKNHLLDRADEWLLASGKFQALVYKEDIEAFLRTRGCAGYQMLGLNDFPGQGTALVGVLDAFWEDKGYVSAGAFRRFNGPVVPLAIMNKRVWTSDETFSAKIRIAQYSGNTLKAVRPVWEVTDAAGKPLVTGQLTGGDIPVGNATELGEVTFPLAPVTQAARLILRVSFPGTEWGNDWSFWVYPKQLPERPDTVVICRTRDDALAKLAAGSSVLWLPDLNNVPGNTAGTFQPIYWNKAWFPGQREHTLGLLIQNKHPAFAAFPTDFHTDWQWWDLMMHSKPIVLDQLPPSVRPLVEPIDDWNTARRLGTLLEAKVGKGKLLLATMDLETDLANRPVARQLRASLLAYASSAAFNPQDELTESQLASLVAAQADTKIVRVEADSENLKHPAANAFDGNPNTIWHTEWTGRSPGYPHELRIELANPMTLTGVSLLPRQDGIPNGGVRQIEILVSHDKIQWKSAAKQPLFDTAEWKNVSFPAVQAKFLMIRALAPQNPKERFAAFAEVALQIKD